MSKLLHYTLSFEGTLYSLDRKRKYSFESTAALDNGRSIVCLRDISGGKIAGYIKFDASYDERNKSTDTLMSEFNDVLALKGMILEMKKEPELHWITPEGKTMKTISNTQSLAYSIDVLIKTISAETLAQANNLFNRINSEQELSEMACTLRKIQEIPIDAGSFLIHWTQFNKKYDQSSQTHRRNGSEWKRIEAHVNDFSDMQIAVIHDRNKPLFALLVQSGIFNKKRQVNESKELALAINKRNKTEIVVRAVSCVYALRNDLVHELVFKFCDPSVLINFVRDLIYLKLVADNERLALGKP